VVLAEDIYINLVNFVRFRIPDHTMQNPPSEGVRKANARLALEILFKIVKRNRRWAYTVHESLGDSLNHAHHKRAVSSSKMKAMMKAVDKDLKVINDGLRKGNKEQAGALQQLLHLMDEGPEIFRTVYFQGIGSPLNRLFEDPGDNSKVAEIVDRKDVILLLLKVALKDFEAPGSWRSCRCGELYRLLTLIDKGSKMYRVTRTHFSEFITAMDTVTQPLKQMLLDLKGSNEGKRLGALGDIVNILENDQRLVPCLKGPGIVPGIVSGLAGVIKKDKPQTLLLMAFYAVKRLARHYQPTTNELAEGSLFVA
jgi:hypothetical protein